ncbi:MAG: LamG-like jellyroll fold domain-containing protein, partial [Acidimicrobiales bacterium]
TVKTRRKLSATTGGLPTNTLRDNDQFGTSVTGAGDLDADGIPDLAVGTPGDDDGGTDRGAVHLLTMRRDGTMTNRRKLSALGGLQSALRDNDRLGTAVASLGDLDGDGIGDLAIGAPGDDDGGTDRGAIFTIRMNSLGGSSGMMASDPRLWVDAAATDTVVQRNGVVVAWRDRSGNGSDLSTDTVAYDPAGLNGRPAVTTDGVATLSTTQTSYPLGSTIFAVARMQGGRTGRLVTGVWNNWLFGWHGGCEDRAHFDSWVHAPCPAASTVPVLYSATTGNGQASFWRNGTLLRSAPGTFTSPNGLAIGGQWSETSEGAVSELIVYPRVLGDAERRRVEATLLSKWSINAASSVGGPVAWLDASDASSIEQTDGVVTRWRDRSGRGADVRSTRAASSARRDTTGLNTRPAIVFDGRGTLSTRRQFNPAGSTVFAVARYTGQGASARVISSFSNNWLLGWHGGCIDRAHFDGWVNGAPCGSVGASPLLYSATTGNGQASYWRNGSLVGSAVGGFTSPNGLSVGGHAAYEWSASAVSEVLVYDRVLTPEERQATEAYLVDKWGLLTTGITLPAPARAASPALWVDATDAATAITNSRGAVTRWNDKSGNGNDLTWNDAATYDTAGLNGLPAVRTTGLGSLYSNRNFTGTGSTVIAVARMTSTSPAGSIVGGTGWFLGWHAGLQDRTYANYQWVACCGSPSSTQAILYGLSAGSGTARAYRNGALQASINGSFSGLNGLAIGAREAGGTEFGVGAISEVIVYDRVLSDSDRQAVERYLARKWGVGLVAAEPASPYAATVSSLPGLEGHWRLGETEVETVARDASGWTRNGTYDAAVTRSIPTGIVGETDTAVRFAGTGNGVRMSDQFDFTGTRPFSVALWARIPSSTPQWARIVSKEDVAVGPQRRGWYLAVDTAGGAAVFERWNGSERDSASALVPLDTWVQLVATYDGSRVRLYTNGSIADDEPATVSLPDTAMPFTLGRNAADLTDHFLGGDLDEVAVWSRALSAAEVGRLASRAAPSAPTTVTVANGESEAVVSWTAPAVTGAGPVNGSTVTAVAPAGFGLPPAQCSVAGAGTSCRLTGLLNGVAYTVTVSASNIAGTGPTSAPVTARAYPASVMSGVSFALWLDGAEASTLFADTEATTATTPGGAIARWNDRSPRANHLTQAVPAARATAGALGDLTAPTFDGVDDSYILDVTKLPRGTTPATVFTVAVQDSTTPVSDGTRTVVSWGDAGIGQARSLIKGPGSAFAYLDTGATTFAMPASLQWPTAQPALVDADFSAATVRARVGGALSYQSATMANNTGSAGARVGGSPWSAAQHWQGRIAEVIVVEGTLTTTQIGRVQAYLTRKWALSSSLPAEALRAGSAPLGLYRLDEPVGSSVATDTSGNGRNGTYMPGVTLGVPGPRANMTGTRTSTQGAANLGAAMNSAFSSTSAFTITGWVRKNNWGEYGTIAANYDGRGVIVHVSPNGRQVGLYLIQTWAPDTIMTWTGDVMSPGVWNHVAVTYDGSRRASGVNVYVNGNPVSSAPGYDNLAGQAVTTAPMYAGRRPDWSPGHGDDYAEIGLFNRVLSRDEILAFASTA